MSMLPGIYKAHIQKATLGEAKTGNPQIVYEFILDGILDSDGEFVDCAHVPRTIYRVITENTIDYVVPELQALGYDRDGFDDLDPDSPNAFDFQGIETTVEMKLEMYDDKPRERWQFTRKGQGKKLEQSGVSKLNAMFGGKLKSGKADNGTRAPVARVKNTRQSALPSGGDAAEPGDNGESNDPIPF
jgi:hypothetical protein